MSKDNERLSKLVESAKKAVVVTPDNIQRMKKVQEAAKQTAKKS